MIYTIITYIRLRRSQSTFEEDDINLIKTILGKNEYIKGVIDIKNYIRTEGYMDTYSNLRSIDRLHKLSCNWIYEIKRLKIAHPSLNQEDINKILYAKSIGEVYDIIIKGEIGSDKTNALVTVGRLYNLKN